MRFEIRSGGVGIILLGLVALSTMVFVFGLYEGYEIGIQSQSSSTQMATAYPLEGPPPAGENSASAETSSGAISFSGGSASGKNPHVAQNSPAATVPSPAASIAPSAPPSVAAATPEYSPERGSAPRLADAGVTRVK